MKMNARRAKAREGLSTNGPWAMTCAICERDVDLLASDTVKTAISMAGSVSDAIVISRLDPIPQKAVPISMPASAVKNLDMANSETMAITSAVEDKGRSTTADV